MRQDVYVKFAAALDRQRADARREYVGVKLAETLRRMGEKRAALTLGGVTPGGVVNTAQTVPSSSAVQVQTGKPGVIADIQRRLQPYMNPSGAVGAGVSALGTLALTGALSRKKSWMSRLLHLLGGAGLLYGGYRVFTDKNLQGLVNQYGGKVIKAIGDYAGKALSRVGSGSSV